MSFDGAELRNEIEEMFGDLQQPCDEETRSERIFPQIEKGDGAPTNGRAAYRGGFNRGFRVFIPNPVKTPERKIAMRDFKRKYDEADIRARLLAGELPKTGGRGRPPTRWFKVAKELGIPLPAPARKYRESGIKDRLLAGERPKLNGRGRPPARWLKVAKELGIVLPEPGAK